VLQIQGVVRDVPVADHVVKYALRLVRATRFPEKGEPDPRPDFLSNYLRWGAGPRASQNLILAGKAHALLHGRTHVEPEDIQAVTLPVLRHRILTNFAAEADGVSSDDLIMQLLDTIKVDASSDAQAEAVLR